MKKSISAIVLSVLLVTLAFGTAFAKEEYRIKFGYSASDKAVSYTHLDVYKRQLQHGLV